MTPQQRIDAFDRVLTAHTFVLQRLIAIVHDLDPAAIEEELRQARLQVQVIETDRFRSAELPEHRLIRDILETALDRQAPRPG